MTNDEAICVLKNTAWLGSEEQAEKVSEAVRMAIDALKCNDIIACGDCKYYIPHDERCGYWNRDVKPLEWCCHAERRWKG